MTAPTDFATLQSRLLERLLTGTPEDASTIVVCPSISFSAAELRKIVGIQHYEERLLFMLLLLRDPSLELVFPTSVAIDPAVVDYYLDFLDDPEDARRRLHLFTVDDPAPTALTNKLLARPDVVDAIRACIGDPDTSLIIPFNVTWSEAQLAFALGIGLYGADPNLVWLGSKSGARQVAAEAGVDIFPGSEDLFSLADIGTAALQLRDSNPAAVAVVAKLNNGFSGQGNVVIDIDGLRTPLESSDAVFCASEESWESFAAKVEAEGAIVEELGRAPGITSPSVQLRILPGGRAEVVSTHDQILGGPDDQVYLGCRFPARDEYRERIQDAALRVARVMARRGVIGSFGIDFVVVPDRGVYLSEINLRLGGTTHPYLMARYVTSGEYDASAGVLRVGDGGTRVYKASDNIKSERYIGLEPARLIAAVAQAGLAYDEKTGTGTTLHLLGALPEYGKYGLLCIAETHEAADAMYDDVVRTVDALVPAG